MESALSPIVPEDQLRSNQVELRLGLRARAIDPSGGTVLLDDAEALPADSVLLATGASPRRLRATPAASASLHTETPNGQILLPKTASCIGSHSPPAPARPNQASTTPGEAARCMRSGSRLPCRSGSTGQGQPVRQA
jgi:NADPH-dependent 2,4-dienoyl-CoA reductase/sulfur reductase-like enzyme